jgi:leucyl aminopeptidase
LSANNLFFNTTFPSMPENAKAKGVLAPADILLGADSTAAARPISLVSEARLERGLAELSGPQRAWLEAIGFSGALKRHALLPAADGGLAGVLYGIGEGRTGEPSGPGALLIGQLPTLLPAGIYRLAGSVDEAELAALAWGLGAYRFRRYKTEPGADLPKLKLPDGIDRARVLAIVEAVWLARDLINTPASDMGPAELEAAASALGARYRAQVSSIVGDDLLAANFPMIHAVGRASSRAPRLIDLVWGRADAPTVTLVGKGICFDTGGLDIKPSSAMLMMKKDMAGAATALALGAMIMGLGLDLRLRILIPAAENSIAGNAFRPRDVLATRAGQTVEVGNTDAEGRLVLADALTLADEDAPDMLLAFSTLTGAARVALGPDLPPFYTEDDVLAAEIAAAGESVGDPIWRMPFWKGYEKSLDSEVADMANVSETPMAGSVIAALFLRRFVSRARRFVHFDIYGWRASPSPLGPKGGEPQAARAMLKVLEQRYRHAPRAGRESKP